MDSNGVRFQDEDKLYDIGFQDGYEKASKILAKNPENLELLNILNLPKYRDGYKAGIEEARKEYESVRQR